MKNDDKKLAVYVMLIVMERILKTRQVNQKDIELRILTSM